MKILHINDVASVGSTLVTGLQNLGYVAELRRLRLVAGRRSAAIKLLAAPLRLQEILATNQQIKKTGYDVVHIHFAYLGWLGIVGRYPYFLHCHGSDVRKGLLDPLKRWSVIQSLQKAHCVFFSTPDLAPIVQPIRPNAIFLPNPVNTNLFLPQLTLQNSPLKVLIISVLSPIKRVDIAFEAVKRLVAIYPDIEVTALDYGSQKKQFYGIPGVRFIPPVPYNLMPTLINSHDLIIGQLGIGSLGMAELESMACGKPVVCYFKYSNQYPEPPPVYSTNQPQQIVEYLSALIENPKLRRELGEQSRTWVQRYHELMVIAKQLEQVYVNYISDLQSVN